MTPFTDRTSLADVARMGGVPLGGRGYAARTNALAPDHWRIEFHPAAQNDGALAPLGTPATQ